MRKNLLLLSVAVLLAACADDQHSTAPKAPRSGAASRSVADSPPGPGAKPIDQVGWTQAVTITSAPHAVAPGTSGVAIATCPAGTTLVGGGYTLDFTTISVAPLVYLNTPGIGSISWNAAVTNLNPVGGSSISVTSIARCAS
jgi:hypothetical protein